MLTALLSVERYCRKNLSSWPRSCHATPTPPRTAPPLAFLKVEKTSPLVFLCVCFLRRAARRFSVDSLMVERVLSGRETNVLPTCTRSLSHSCCEGRRAADVCSVLFQTYPPLYSHLSPSLLLTCAVKPVFFFSFLLFPFPSSFSSAVGVYLAFFPLDSACCSVNLNHCTHSHTTHTRHEDPHISNRRKISTTAEKIRRSSDSLQQPSLSLCVLFCQLSFSDRAFHLFLFLFLPRVLLLELPLLSVHWQLRTV